MGFVYFLKFMIWIVGVFVVSYFARVAVRRERLERMEVDQPSDLMKDEERKRIDRQIVSELPLIDKVAFLGLKAMMQPWMALTKGANIIIGTEMEMVLEPAGIPDSSESDDDFMAEEEDDDPESEEEEDE